MPSGGSGIERIAVIGLGKLGACIAATLASRGFEVIGFDVDPDKTNSLARGVAPVEEPNLQETICLAGSRLKAADDLPKAVHHSDASFFVPATPSLPDGSFSNQYLLEALRAVAQEARRLKKERYLFVVNSTVTPGTLDRVLTPLLEGILGKCGEQFGLCYNPEFIALGNVIRGLLEPDLVLIGESDAPSGQLLGKVCERFCTNAPPIERMSNLEAELAKISVNCAVTMKISFVNQLSAVCAKIPGADPHVILKAIGKDRRIGQDYLKPGLGFGGPCFPRDNRLFQYTAGSVGVEVPLAEATDKVNESVNQRLLDTVLAHSSESGPVAVLGLAYKPFTGVTDCSPGIWLCQQLAERGRLVFAHDYLAVASAKAALSNGRVQTCDDPHEILRRGCQAFVITCPWPNYKEFFSSRTVDVLRPGTVIVDPWSILDGIAPRLNNVRHITHLG